MAAITLSNVTSQSAAQAIPMAKTAPVNAVPAVRESASLKPDTVKLSPAAQAKMMHREGQIPALIAATLGTNVSAVDGYLGIKAAAATQATPTPMQAQPAEVAPHSESSAQAAPAQTNPPAATGQSPVPVAK